MPKIWCYLLLRYLKIFLLSIFSFIIALFVMRLKEIAGFVALHAEGRSILLFSFYQLPYLFPIATSISSVIAAMLLFLNHHRELTALRSSGLSAFQLLFPILMMGIIVSLFNFTVVAEVVPYCKKLAKKLYVQATSDNPFYIFNQIFEGRIPHAYLEMKSFREGKEAKEVLVILEHGDRLGLVTAKKFFLDGDFLKGSEVSTILTPCSEKKSDMDRLVIENQQFVSLKKEILNNLLQKEKERTKFSHLSFKALLRESKVRGTVFSSYLGIEVARRLSLSLAPFVLTFLGAAVGMGGGEKRGRGVLSVTLLIILYLAAFLCAKSVKCGPEISWGLYFIPFFLIVLFSLHRLRKI